VRWGQFRRMVRAAPTVLLRDGKLDGAAMRRERIVEGEVLQSVRSSGGCELEDALVVFLQSDGSLAVIMR
jgi:uncharacterized membrane protein YcaP (DUF421 family)